MVLWTKNKLLRIKNKKKYRSILLLCTKIKKNIIPMKQVKKLSLVMLWLCSLCLPLFSCSKDETWNNGDCALSVKLNNDKIEKETSMYASSDGGTYKLYIEVSPEDLKWTITTEGDDLLALSSENGTGNAEIEIEALPLPENMEKRESKLNISADGCKSTYSLTFIQSKELPLRFPRRTESQIANNKPGWSKGQDPEDFENPASDYNIHNMVTTSHVALLWHKKFGKDPKSAAPGYRFDPERAVQEAQKCYDFIIDELHFSNRTTSAAAKTKFIVFVDYEKGASATGGGIDEVPVVNIKPQSLQDDSDFGIYYHEMSHGFQFTSGWDNPQSGINSDGMKENTTHQGIHEYTSQWTLMNKYTDWGVRQNNHLSTYMNQTHLAFPHTENQYRAPYLLQYWNEKHSESGTEYGEFVSRLWKEYKKEDNQDVIVTFKRLTGLSQSEMMDEMWESAARNITWDLELIRDGYKTLANQHKTKLEKRTQGSYKIKNEVCPQNYGYNAIKLSGFKAGEKVSVKLSKNTSATGLNVIKPELCDYRVGFMAYTSDGKRMYSEKPASGSMNVNAEFSIPANTEHLWLIILAGPTEHFWDRKAYNESKQNCWPYTFNIVGAEPDSKACGL